jgi:hypothetical protein
MGSQDSLSRRQFISTMAPTAASPTSAPRSHVVRFKPTPLPPQAFAWKDQGVLDLANLPYAKRRSVPVRAVGC